MPNNLTWKYIFRSKHVLALLLGVDLVLLELLLVFDVLLNLLLRGQPRL